MPFFVGEFDASYDPRKKRLAIPASCREYINRDEDGTDYLVVLGPDRRLWIYPDRYFRTRVAPMPKNAFPNRSAQKLGSMFAFARFVKPDTQGRIILPDKPVSRAKMGESLTLVGKGDHMELWGSDEWERHVEQEMAEYGKNLLDMGDGLDDEPSEESE